MDSQILFITGTDTGVGKTVFATLLTQQLHEQGIHVAALKPICSGGRDDARKLHAAAGRVLSLDKVNPWHFRAPLSPLLAARRERRKLRLAQVVKQVRSVARRFDVVIVEGAGGLLSPLGEGFDSRDLITALKVDPIIVAPNCLGVVNHVLLTLEALPKSFARRAQIILVNPPRPDIASRTNAALLAEYVPPRTIHVLPWFKNSADVIRHGRIGSFPGD